MLPARIAEHEHCKRRFDAITDPTQMPDNLLFSYLLSAEIVRIGRELTSAEQLVVLNQYVAWYKQHNIAIPHPEWVERNREKWSNNSPSHV